MKSYPCKIRINKRAVKEYMHQIIGQPDTLIAMSKFILLLASTEIWEPQFKYLYNLHGLIGNYKGIYDVHLPIREDLVVLFAVINPLKIKIKSIGSHNDLFD